MSGQVPAPRAARIEPQPEAVAPMQAPGKKPPRGADGTFVSTMSARLPSWRIWAGGVVVLVLVELANIASGALTGKTRGRWTPFIVFNDLIYWFSWYAVSPLVFLVARRYRLDRPTLLSVAVHLPAALGLFALAALLRTLVRWPIWGLPRETFVETLRYSFSSSLMTFLPLYTVTVLLYYTLEY